MIDRAGTFRIFWSIVLPMARPAIVTISILSFQGSWNELSHFIVSTQSSALTTLTKGVPRWPVVSCPKVTNTRSNWRLPSS